MVKGQHDAMDAAADRGAQQPPGLGRRLAAAAEDRSSQAQRIAGPGWRPAQGADGAALDAGLDKPGLKFRKAVGVRRGHERDQDHGILVSGPILRFVNNPPGRMSISSTRLTSPRHILACQTSISIEALASPLWAVATRNAPGGFRGCLSPAKPRILKSQLDIRLTPFSRQVTTTRTSYPEPAKLSNTSCWCASSLQMTMTPNCSLYLESGASSMPSPPVSPSSSPISPIEKPVSVRSKPSPCNSPISTLSRSSSQPPFSVSLLSAIT